jgi:hypothetical protein
VPRLKGFNVGFELLSGTTLDQARTLVDEINARIVGGIVTPRVNDSMNDILSNEAAWRKLCHLALCEKDPQRLVQRIAAVSLAVIDHIDSGFPNLSSAERIALHDAWDMLISLLDMASRDLSKSE